MIRLASGLISITVASVIGAAVVADLVVHAPSSLILAAWRRWREDPYDAYWFGDYDHDAVTDTLAAAGAEARSGCTCEGCEHLRATAAEAVFRVTADDIAELDRIGIAWEVDPA